MFVCGEALKIIFYLIMTEMVCLPCVIMPVFIWIWFTWILPIITKLRNKFWPKKTN